MAWLSEHRADLAPSLAELAPDETAANDSPDDLLELLLGVCFLLVELLARFLEMMQRTSELREVNVCGRFGSDRFHPEEELVSSAVLSRERREDLLHRQDTRQTVEQVGLVLRYCREPAAKPLRAPTGVPR